MNRRAYLLGDSGRPPVAYRHPLIPTIFDISSRSITHWDLPQNISIPSGPSKRFWRVNFHGVEVSGLPFVPGGSSEHPERCLTGLMHLWNPSWQDRILEAHAERGLTHFVNWWPNAREWVTVSNFVAQLKRQKSWGFYTSVNWTSKDFDIRDGTLAQRRFGVKACLRACLDADVLDIDQPFWEGDLFNNPAYLPEWIGWLADQSGSRVDHYAHFSPLRTAWQRNGFPRAAFWAENPSLTGLLYQADPAMNIGDMQAHLHDAQTSAAGLSGKVIVGFELKASPAFTQDEWTEDRCACYGWGALCTPGDIPISGGNGAWYPDGRPI